jgi:N-methylhydantoinase A
LPEAPMEIVQLSATALDTGRPPLPAVAVPEGLEPAEPRRRPVFFKGEGWVDTGVVQRAQLSIEVSLAGPLVVEEPDSTVLVLEGQHVRLDRSGALILEPWAEARGSRADREVEATVG